MVLLSPLRGSGTCRNEMMRKWSVLTVIVFFLVVYGIAAVSVVGEDKGYSAVENRVLQKFPKVSKKRIMNGKFQETYEVYLSDQFPARDAWIQVKSQAERLAGKTESNGVYFGKKGYLLEKYTKEDFDKKQVRKNVRALKTFVEGLQKEGMADHVKVMMVPSKTKVYHEYLPAFAQSYDEDKLYGKLLEALPEGVLVPVEETLLSHKEEPLYYRNDHHWTTLGAWYGYEAYLLACGELEEAPLEKNAVENGVKNGQAGKENGTVEEKQGEMKGKGRREEAERKKQALKTVSTDFLGTTYSKVNMYKQKDEIAVYEPEGEFSVVYNLGEKTEDTFYQWEFLEKKDQYSVFSGGNQGVLEITGGRKNGRTLMLVKDSFANCMVPFLMEDYEKVVVLDMRQLNVGLSRLVRMYQPTDVLVLYNLVQFMQDWEFARKANNSL